MQLISSQLGLAQLGANQLGSATNTPVSGTPTLTQTAIIPSRVAFGPGSVAFPPQTVSQTAIIPSRVAFGPGSLSVGISQLYVIPSRVAFGTGAVLQRTYLSVLIDGVDVTDLVLDNSLQITNPLSNSTTASFGLWDKTGTVVPQVGQEVVIYLGGVRIFGGSVEQPFQTAYQAMRGSLFSGSGGGSVGGVGSATGSSSSGGVQCTDFSNLLDRRYVGAYFDANGAPVPTFLQDIVQFIVDTYFAQDGITYDDSDGDPGVNLGPTLFNWVTGRQAFNQLSSLTGWDFSVDNYKVLRFYPSGNGIGTAPFNIADNDGNVYAESLGVEYYRSKYRNRQGVRSPTGSSQLWSDIFSTAQPGPFANNPQPPDGIRKNFIELYGFTAIPTVTVNGVPQIVAQLLSVGGFAPPVYDWYIVQPVTPLPSFGLFQNPSHAAISSSSTLIISYPIPLAPIYWVQNDSQILARAAIEGNSGIYEDVENAPSVTDPAAIVAYAAGLLARYGNGIPFQVTYSSRTQKPPFAGQVQTIHITNPPLDFTGLISQVQWQDVDGTFMQMGVTVLSGEYQGDFTQFFAALVAQAQLAQPSAFSNYQFLIAPTYPGITNPGAPGGAQQGRQIIIRAVEMMYSFSVTLRADEPAVAVETEFDLFDASQSVTLATIFFAAGESGTKTVYVPQNNPVRLYSGDVLFINIAGSGSNATIKDAVCTLVTSVAVT